MSRKWQAFFGAVALSFVVVFVVGLFFYPAAWHGPEHKAKLVAVGERKWLVEGNNRPAPWYVTFRMENGEEVSLSVVHDFLDRDPLSQVYYVHQEGGQWRVRK